MPKHYIRSWGFLLRGSARRKRKKAGRSTEKQRARAKERYRASPAAKSFCQSLAVILLVLASISLVTDVFDQGAHSIAWVLIRFMAVLIPVVFVACGLTQGNWFSAFLFALSVAVGLTPEMLPMVITACLAKGSGAMGKKQTVVKNINAMQGFGSMDILCGQNRHFDRRPYFPGILYGHPGE